VDQCVVDSDIFQKTPGMFSRVKKYVMYDLLKRENINWRVLNLNYYI